MELIQLEFIKTVKSKYLDQGVQKLEEALC